MSIFSGKFDSIGPGFHLTPLLLRMVLGALGILAFLILGVIILWV